MLKLNCEWKKELSEELKKPYCKELFERVEHEYADYTVYPPKDEIFAALNHTSPDKVRAVIIGQDPYHGPDQAEGLCFSVKKGVIIPKSLVNIYKELSDDIGCDIPEHGSLMKWADEGVLLLNSILTVREHEPMSHKGIGWERFTDAVIDVVEDQDRPIVYILWGKPALTKAKMVRNPKHLILTAPHPSPLSAYRGFFGSRPFSETNEFLVENGEEPIDWVI